jgi:hypothetical protein
VHRSERKDFLKSTLDRAFDIFCRGIVDIERRGCLKDVRWKRTVQKGIEYPFMADG